MTGVIDIGSNTIRIVMYDRGLQISNKGINSQIISDTKKGVLTPEGIERLCAQLKCLIEKANGERVLTFGTYSLRCLENREEVKKRVFESIGIEIDILSGEMEAYYDFLGLMSTLPENSSGIGVDLGGGSGQIMVFREGKLKFSSSYPIGCRRVKNKFVKGIFPDEQEYQKIDNYIKEKLPDIDLGEKSPLYMMGGTAKTAVKLYTYIKGSENTNIIKTDEIYDVIRFLKEIPPEQMKNILKNRYDNIAVGLVIMEIIARAVKSPEIIIKKCGVRDGYISKNGTKNE